jgi:hypothetical protein
MLAQGWRLRPLPSAGIAIAVALAAARVGWNLARPDDLFLDSWVLVHILRIMTEGAEPLPRAALTLHYPLAYLPFYPLAELLGPFETVKLAYPVLASLAAIPAFLLVRRGPMPVAGIVAVLFLPDFLIKTLTGTPQGLALPLFLLALHFAVRRHRAGFVVASTAVLFTHHLTGLITLVLYYAFWVLARRREPGFLRREWPYLLYFGLWPLYWAWTFSNTNQSYMAPILLVLTAIFGVPLAAVLFVSANRLRGVVYHAGGFVARMPTAMLLAIVGTAAVAGWLLTDVILESPGLSTAALANRTVTGIYAALMVLGGAAALARRHVGLTLFAATLLALGAIVLAFGCQHVFDGLRVADYAVLGGIAALFAPGLRARWMSRRSRSLGASCGCSRATTGYSRTPRASGTPPAGSRATYPSGPPSPPTPRCRCWCWARAGATRRSRAPGGCSTARRSRPMSPS